MNVLYILAKIGECLTFTHSEYTSFMQVTASYNIIQKPVAYNVFNSSTIQELYFFLIS